MKQFLAFDIETTGLNYEKDTILCTGFSNTNYFTSNEEAISYINQINDSCTLTCHNGSFDIKFLWKQAGLDPSIVPQFDTMIAAYLLKDRPMKLSLDSLVSYYLGLPSWKDDIKSGAVFQDPELMKEYCLQDCYYTAQLAPILEAKLKEEGRLEFFYRLMEVRNMLTRAEYRGVNFDPCAALELKTLLTCQLEDVESALKSEASDIVEAYKLETGARSFNFNSPKQVLWLLKNLGLTTLHPVTKKESADVTVLELNKGQHPVIDILLQMRKLKKKITSIEGYEEDALSGNGRIRANFNVSNVRTGRLSSSGPNLQQVDRDPKVRALFTASPNHSLVVGDMAQIEVRMAAHYSKDPTLIKMFQNDEDFYGTIAVEVLNSRFHPNEVKEKDPIKRSVAKVIGLSILYGVGPNKLKMFIKEKGGVEYSHTEIRMIINRYFEQFKGLKELQMGVHRQAERNGFLTNLLGRKVDVPQAEIYMKGVNSLLQSSASDLLLFRTLQIEKKLPWAKILLLVHDELIIEVPEGREEEAMGLLKVIMEETDSLKFRVPLKFSCAYGKNWACKE